MASTVIKNWDNKTWLSSKNYINSFNKFLIKNIKINSKSRILDIGCGRGKILGSLSSKLRFKKKPLVIIVGCVAQAEHQEMLKNYLTMIL